MAVAILVLLVVREVGAPDCAALKLIVIDEDSGVDNIGCDVSAPGVRVRENSIELDLTLSDAVKTPSSLEKMEVK